MLEVSSIPRRRSIFLTDLQAASWRPPGRGDDGLKRVAGQARGQAAALGGDRPGQAGRRKPGRDRLKLDVPVVTVGSSRSWSARSSTISARTRPTACASG